MTTRVAINGFGRIGRLTLRRIAEVEDNIEVVAILRPNSSNKNK